VQSATGKIRAKAQLLAGMALETPPESLAWDNGAFIADGDTSRLQTIADVAMYAHGTGALPPGVEGGLDAQTVYRD
jgi:carbon-monoxide dehydrogenase large subunit